MESKQRIIGCDFDKTMAHYEDGDIDKLGPEHVGEPIPEMVEKIKQALADGAEVYVFTARVNPGDGTFKKALNATKSYVVISEWCQRNIGTVLPITHEKSWRWSEIWDDKAKEVLPNTGIFITELMDAAQ